VRWDHPRRSGGAEVCLAGDTPILLGDGRTRPLADVRVGDVLYGTARRGAFRRYVHTEVLAHWETRKPAYRVTLEDGTLLVASGDHRLLTRRGWKHVAAADGGADPRPHLSTADKLLGVGQFSAAPEESPDYRTGYLCGLIRSAGDRVSGRSPGDGRPFRLALVDIEPLQRAQRYLAELGLPMRQFVFEQRFGPGEEAPSIRTSSAEAMARIREIVRWPATATADWCKGFLAGAFDAAGSYRRGVLGISIGDVVISNQVVSCLWDHGFRYAIDVTPGSSGLRDVRIAGGLREHLRFFHTTGPAATRKCSIATTAIRSGVRLGVVSVEPLGVELPMYDITTRTEDFIANGLVSHNCIAGNTHPYLDLDAGHDVHSQIVVKVNAAELLRCDCSRPSSNCERRTPILPRGRWARV